MPSAAGGAPAWHVRPPAAGGPPARDRLAHLAGRPARHPFHTELICIVDTLTSATLVYRDDRRSFSRRAPPLHRAKAAFAWQYLRPYRSAA